jgi:hypothetical protein
METFYKARSNQRHERDLHVRINKMHTHIRETELKEEEELKQREETITKRDEELRIQEEQMEKCKKNVLRHSIARNR